MKPYINPADKYATLTYLQLIIYFNNALTSHHCLQIGCVKFQVSPSKVKGKFENMKEIGTHPQMCTDISFSVQANNPTICGQTYLHYSCCTMLTQHLQQLQATEEWGCVIFQLSSLQPIAAILSTHQELIQWLTGDWYLSVLYADGWWYWKINCQKDWAKSTKSNYQRWCKHASLLKSSTWSYEHMKV